MTPPIDPPESVLSDSLPQLENSHSQSRSAPKGVTELKAVNQPADTFPQLNTHMATPTPDTQHPWTLIRASASRRLTPVITVMRKATSAAPPKTWKHGFVWPSPMRSTSRSHSQSVTASNGCPRCSKDGRRSQKRFLGQLTVKPCPITPIGSQY